MRGTRRAIAIAATLLAAVLLTGCDPVGGSSAGSQPVADRTHEGTMEAVSLAAFPECTQEMIDSYSIVAESLMGVSPYPLGWSEVSVAGQGAQLPSPSCTLALREDYYSVIYLGAQQDAADDLAARLGGLGLPATDRAPGPATAAWGSEEAGFVVVRAVAAGEALYSVGLIVEEPVVTIEVSGYSFE